MTLSVKRPGSQPSHLGDVEYREQDERESAVTPERAFGERVRRMRVQQRWTIDGLAERSGVSRAAISKIERGEHSTRLGNVVRIAEAFGVPPGQLLDSVTQPLRVLYRGLAARHEGLRSMVSTKVVAEVDTGVELVRYDLAPYEGPAVLARPKPGACQIIVVLAGDVLVGSGAEQIELTGGDIATVSGHREHPLHNIGVGHAELLLLLASRPQVR